MVVAAGAPLADNRGPMRRNLLALCPLALALACTETTATPDAAGDASSDVTNDLAKPDAFLDATADAAPALPPWPHELPPARELGEVRGMTPRRVIIHSHSVHSHDACDGNPYVDGGPNEPCLQDFRRAICQTRLDAVFLTEHEDRISSVELPTVLQMRAGDEPIMEGGAVVGSWVRCADGHRVMLVPGAENELMPIGLRRHPDLVGGSLDRAYHADDAAGVRRFREAGALVAVAHVEQRTIEHLRELGPDLVEVYNIHANIGPNIANIASPEFDLGQALVDVLRFRNTTSGLEPDLAFLSLFAENTNDLAKFAQLWSEGRAIPGIAASDAHQNAIPAVLSDGERGDSYRRIFRFFSNEVLVAGEFTRASALEALRRGRSYVVFEAFGTPTGFSFHAQTRDGTAHEMGATVRMADGPELVLRGPTLLLPREPLAQPRVELRVYRAEGDRWVMAQRWDGAAAAAGVRWTPPSPGAYRAEVRIVPEHARPYLPGLEARVRDVPWIYANPILITP